MDYIQTDYSDNDSINPSANDGWKEWERIVKTNISYEILVNDCVESTALLDDIVEIMVETIAFARDFVMVGDVKYPYEFTKDKLLKLNQFHIMYVLSGLEEAAPKMTNPKAYLLKCLMNAPITMNSYYHTRVQHDMRNGMTL